MKFTVKAIRKFGIDYYGIYLGSMLVTTFMSRQQADSYVKRNEGKLAKAA